MRNNTEPNLKSLEKKLARIKVRQGQVDSEIAKLEKERTELKVMAAQILTPLIRERDRLDALVQGEKAPLTEEEKLFARHIDGLELTVRPANCLKSEGIKTIGDLLKSTDHDLLKIPNLGRKGIEEIRVALGSRGLSIGRLAHLKK